jgi:drug/metabolite transporter (DMT)-like permease
LALPGRGLVPALLAIGIWSSLAILSTATARLPPLFTTGVALTIGGLAGLPKVKDWRIPPGTFAVGLGGIFGYHALLFAAFRLAPAVEVNLLNYLWPLLIVVLSPLVLPGLRLTPRHVAGAILGLLGAVLVATGAGARSGAASLQVASLPGYLMAVAAALLWALYSLLTKRLPPFPTGAVGGFCLAAGLLSLALFRLEGGASFALPMPGAGEWFALAALGLGPMGLAFYAWDYAMKKGDPRVIGSLAYLTPLLSTLNLVVFGGRSLTAQAGVALALIVGGAVLGSTGRAEEKPMAGQGSAEPQAGRRG